ncbi:hypothetical protein IW249_000593 [Micromonospora vinacea]|uniref:DUF3592 domain-containing protein n=1 Tax=Micromonospora vinacea TaxID=709878 RepID=A0ABS0JWT0_9ACTN|nr:DUF3592 domain-containing protein [Micromonospora vinacea]MBG6100179.1 hypothetical protein [Micromonospora vinacea]WTA66658.1 hypothetical protein OHB51_30045 [Micromonospora sp. NBC_00855]
MVKRYRRRSRATGPRITGQSTELVDPKPRSRWRPGYWLRHPALGVAVGALLVFVLVTCGLGNLRHRNDLVERGERAVGTVREVHGRQWWVSVSFTTRSGEEVIAWISHSPWDEPSVGEEVDVIYDRVDPVGSAYLSDDEPGMLYPTLLLAGSTVLALAYAWWLRRNWNRLRGDAESWRSRQPVPRLGERRQPARTHGRSAP